MWLVEEPRLAEGTAAFVQLAGDKWKRRHQGGAHSEHCQRFMRLFLTMPVRERTVFLSRGPEAAVFQVGCRTSNSSPDKFSMTWLTWNIHQIHRRFLGVGGSVLLEKPRLTAHAVLSFFLYSVLSEQRARNLLLQASLLGLIKQAEETLLRETPVHLQ